MSGQEISKVAVIGTSNIGAVKYAQSRIEAAYPRLSVTCYGLPGGKFDAARLVGTEFGPDRGDTAAMKLALRINGAPTLDLSRFTHILVIGDTLGLPATLWAALSYDVADWPTRTGRDLLSLPALKATVEEAIAARADHLHSQFGASELHVAHAPYPTTAVVARGVHHKQPYAAVAAYPHAAALQSLYRDALTRALADRGMTLVPQPEETIAQPFLTKEPYGRGARDFRNKDNLLDDHRHMNADFGASLFNAFAIAIGAAP